MDSLPLLSEIESDGAVAHGCGRARAGGRKDQGTEEGRKEAALLTHGFLFTPCVRARCAPSKLTLPLSFFQEQQAGERERATVGRGTVWYMQDSQPILPLLHPSRACHPYSLILLSWRLIDLPKVL